jgi:membrane-associated phospholipid phosphatase
MIAGVLLGFGVGFAAAWLYFRRQRLLRTRKEWYADPAVASRFGPDPDPNGWSYYE